MIFLKSDGSYSIVNERLGSWNKGSWFSNLHHCTMSQGIVYHNVSSYGQLYQWDSQQDEKDETGKAAQVLRVGLVAEIVMLCD